MKEIRTTNFIIKRRNLQWYWCTKLQKKKRFFSYEQSEINLSNKLIPKRIQDQKKRKIIRVTEEKKIITKIEEEVLKEK